MPNPYNKRAAALDAVNEASGELLNADLRREKSRKKLLRSIERARKADVPVADVATLLDVTPQRVYQMLDNG